MTSIIVSLKRLLKLRSISRKEIKLKVSQIKAFIWQLCLKPSLSMQTNGTWQGTLTLKRFNKTHVAVSSEKGLDKIHLGFYHSGIPLTNLGFVHSVHIIPGAFFTSNFSFSLYLHVINFWQDIEFSTYLKRVVSKHFADRITTKKAFEYMPMTLYKI